jgi:hypothetical protein
MNVVKENNKDKNKYEEFEGIGVLLPGDNVPLGTLMINVEEPSYVIAIVENNEDKFIGVTPEGDRIGIKYLNTSKWNFITPDEKEKS